jgi:alpha-L-arabinofuranosidase
MKSKQHAWLLIRFRFKDHMKKELWLVFVTLTAGALLAIGQQSVTLSVQTDKPGAKISPTMWGIFFEDINFGADGGLYAELVKNRSFEFPDPLMGWTKLNQSAPPEAISVQDKNPFDVANPHYVRLRAREEDWSGIGNEGFRGIGVRAGAKYRLSAFVRSVDGGETLLRVALIGADGAMLADDKIKGYERDWSKKTVTLRPKATDAKARLQLVLEGTGSVDLDMVSLFPEETWKGRANGLRPDVVQMLADLKPGFMRFPGGCIVEGHTLEGRYQWKSTLGKLENRKLIINRWNDEFKHRPAPDYFQSFGLGFFEFFQLCEDIGAEPLPILNCGMACQFNSGELAPLEQLQPYIQDALDLIEFANGDPNSSPWGRKRAEMGHSRPFNMKLLGVGNEQWGPQYLERYAKFAEKLKAKYPNIQLISSAGPGPADDKFAFAWPKLRELKADIVDEHCYARPDWFLDNTARYDHYDRTGPKVFMGEYAAQSVKTVSPDNRNNWECALAEAAYLIGLERNADVVVMSSYAPLSAHVDAWQWTPNLIWFDNLRVYGTPNYYVQQLFSRNRGDVLLPTQLAGAPTAPNGQPRFYSSATRDAKSGEIIVKVVNATTSTVTAHIQIAGIASVKKGTATVLHSDNLLAENSLNEPRRVAPNEEPVMGVARQFDYGFKPGSLTVLRLSAR